MPIQAAAVLAGHLVLQWDRVDRSLADVIRLNDAETDETPPRHAATFRQAAERIGMSPLIDANLAGVLMIQWDRVHHYLPHVIRLRDAEMTAFLLHDASIVRGIVGQIAAGTAARLGEAEGGWWYMRWVVLEGRLVNLLGDTVVVLVEIVVACCVASMRMG